MNWLDITILVILAVAASMGMGMGLIRAAFGAVGAFIGWLIAAQYADEIGSGLSNSLASDTIVTVVFYGIMIVLGLIVSGIAAKIVTPFLTVFTVGMSALVDKVGGIALGIALGGLVSGAFILGMSRLAYNFEVPESAEVIAGEVERRVPLDPDAVRNSLDEGLTNSALASAFVTITQKVPGDTIGFVPEDFKEALKILEKRIYEKEAAE